MNLSPRIRPAEPADAPTIAVLLAQLGYPASSSEVVTRLDAIRQFGDAVVLVAESEGTVMGLVTGHVIPSIHSTPVVALLTTLVVDERCARTGIGKQLATAVEDWAREQGAVRISVTSGKHRDGAHAFYERIGYDRTGVRLTKILRS